MHYLTAWDTGSTQPNASTLNDKAGLVTSNSAVVPAGTSGSINVFVTDATDVIIDINGYYATPATLPLNGTAAAPALTFGDTTTGLYSDSPGTVSLATSGTNRLTVGAGGNVGIGTTTAGSLLDVAGDINFDGIMRYQGSPALIISGAGATSQYSNVALGWQAFLSNVPGSDSLTGNNNTVLGTRAMYFNTTGYRNTAIGNGAIGANITGFYNTALGMYALAANSTGANNIAIGQQAAVQVSGSNNNNIHIGNLGASTDNATIRIGTPSLQTSFFASGIRGVTTLNADAIPVVIDSNGQLGTASSSRRVKRDIHDMHDTTPTIMSLHPVEFQYQSHSPASPVQYGLIAEEVAGIAPDLVAHNSNGEIETVFYDKVNAMLLNEVQKLHRERQKQQQMIDELRSRLGELERSSNLPEQP